MKQHTAAIRYTAEFQQLATRTTWNDSSLQAQYYKGLKDDVKDELARSEKLITLAELVDKAIKVDNRLWERKAEKRGRGY